MNRKIFVPFCLFVFMLLAVWAGLSVGAVAAQEVLGASETLTGFTAGGYVTVTLNYTGSVPFNTSIYRSFNGVSHDTLLDTVTVTDPDGSQDFVLVTSIDLVSSANEIARDYYLLAVSTGGSTALFQGVYQYPNDMVFVHGGDTVSDTIDIQRVGTNLAISWNLVNNYTYPLASVTAVRARSHGGFDLINAIGLNSPATTPTYQMGGPGEDRLKGGNGTDVLVGGPDKDKIQGNGSTDVVSYFDSPAGVSGSIGVATVMNDGWGAIDNLQTLQNVDGSEFVDVLAGSNLDNVIRGLGGNDNLSGGDGNDTIYGGNGIDTVFGDNNDDTLYGENQRDDLNGGNGNDTIYGGANNDKISGNDGDDTIYANVSPCVNDGALDSINGGNHVVGDTAFYTQSPGTPVDSAAGIEFPNGCP